VKAEVRRQQARVIVGVGGGKALDTARAAAADLSLPVVNCPTTASSDAPCSALSIVYTADGVFEECRVYRKNPDLVLVDTQVIARSPVRLLVAEWVMLSQPGSKRRTCVEGGIRNMRGGASTEALWHWLSCAIATLLEDGAAAAGSYAGSDRDAEPGARRGGEHASFGPGF